MFVHFFQLSVPVDVLHGIIFINAIQTEYWLVANYEGNNNNLSKIQLHESVKSGEKDRNSGQKMLKMSLEANRLRKATSTFGES